MLTRRPISLFDASILYDLYRISPTYFSAISTAPPTLQEVAVDLGNALRDTQRKLELLQTETTCVGYLDYKLDYPSLGDVTINLLLVPDQFQGLGHGRVAIQSLENSLQDHCRQILVGVFAADRSSEQFWVHMGYHFVRDARPLMCWYAKALSPKTPYTPSVASK